MPDKSEYLPIAQRLSRFYSGVDEAQKRVEELLVQDPTLADSQIFFLLSASRGRPSTHMSGKSDDETAPFSLNHRKGRIHY